MDTTNTHAATTTTTDHQSSSSNNTQFDPHNVASWLDQHPQFLNDYLRKIQLQRRHTIMNDQTGQLLANIYSNLRLHSVSIDPTTNTNNSNIENNNDYYNNIINNNTNITTNSHNIDINKLINTILASKSTLINSYFPSSESFLTPSQKQFNTNICTSASTTTTINSNINLNNTAAAAANAGVTNAGTNSTLFNTNPNVSTNNYTDSFYTSTSSSTTTTTTTNNNNNNTNKHDAQSKLNQTFEDYLVNNCELPFDSRKKFKELSLYEKMYALVKILYQSLDLKSTCKKILKTVSLLLDADRCSLFLVVDDDEYETKKALVSVVFDAQSLNTSFDESAVSPALREEDILINNLNTFDKIKIPYGIGIAGYVASTGNPLNIKNAYLDDRFNSSIDKQTGYKTKSILCLPILNELGECIAVAEAINKLSDDGDTNIGFTSSDEEIFAKFMPFISIAIRNSNLYSKSRKEAFTNKILLELATTVFDEQTTVDNLVSKIICHALFLLECEHCQVMLLHNSYKSPKVRQSNKLVDRVYELHHSELPVDPFSQPVALKPVSSHSTKFRIDLETINKVIQTGEILNIKNMKEHNVSQELKEIKSMLCIPVRNSSDHVVALIFACNKIQTDSFNYFSTYDINAAQAFALFCGIGIQNMIMYEKVIRAMNMQQVALDVLSYHASSTNDEVTKLISENIPEPTQLCLHTFSFDENTLDDLNTVKACISVFVDLDLIEKFNIPYEKLCHFFMTVKKNYRPVAYHNWRHGFNVMSSMYTMLTQGKFIGSFGDLEILSLLIACICHDVDHRGTTNTFQIKIQSPLAKLYTTSTMEHHHFNQCIMILHNNVNNILINLSPHEYSIAMDIIEKAILATDLSLHFEKVDTFIEKANSEKDKTFETHEDRELLVSMLMTACDLSGSFKPWKTHYRLSNLVSSEFFQQGDLEKEKFNNEPIDMMNRNKQHQLPKMQIQFLQSVCLPLYNALYLCNPSLKPLVDGCENNLNEWKKLTNDKS